ncbi:MAG TPA: ribose 5-phosphate isomerase B [Dehalococcoidia bacterium]|jgi:ribose 5-phosphate isomerase B|nr:ribose 5-phosphate isomerase B [Dehalococcoidia bacterium]
MRVVLGADHRGYQLKDFLAAYLRDHGYDVIDVGTDNGDSVDYPDLALKVGETLQRGEADRGILVCGSGVGACIAANKLDGIRAGLTHDTYSAHQGVEHDDMNVICIGSRVIGDELAIEIVDSFLGATFIPEERYLRRLNKVKALEALREPPDEPTPKPEASVRRTL